MKKKVPFILLIALICIGLFAGIYWGYPYFSALGQKKRVLNTLATKEFQSVFFSMYDISSFSEEDFATYRGIPTLKLNYQFRSAPEINSALEAIFSSDNRVTNIYVGLDPLMLWHAQKNDIAKVQNSFEEGWFAYADSHPEVTFEILFSFPSLSHWAAMKEDEMNSCIILYQQLADILSGRNNIITYYAGGQEWLIANPANYLDDFSVNSGVAQKLFLLTFCDHEMQITGANSALLLQQTNKLVTAERENPATYPDLSQYDIVFLGDSIIGNYSGSLSVPGVINGLSRASVFNCARGGTSAAELVPGHICFPAMVEEFLSGQPSDTESSCGKGILAYHSASHDGKKLCFIINYGLNDYFLGLPLENPENLFDISTYAGAIRTGIQNLQKNYPNALYIIMGPGTVDSFENGTEILSDKGGTLADYSNLCASLSGELGALYLDLYHAFPEAGETMSDMQDDGIHYSNYGRFVLGRKMVFFMEQVNF